MVSEGGRLEGELADAGGQLLRLPVASKNVWQIHRNVKRIADTARQLRADIIHARSRACAWSAFIATQDLGLPFVTTYHGTYSEGFPFKRQYNAVMAKGDRVIANSRFVAERVNELHKTPWDIMRIIPRGLDPHWFAERTSLPKLPANMQTGEIILMPGRLTRWKGQLFMLSAFAEVRKTFPNTRLVMPGDAQGREKYVQEIRNRVQELHLQDHVWLPGHIADLRPWYQLASVVVSASTEPEAFGRIAIEAQAAGRPVIAAAHGGALETVLDGASGKLFAPGDPVDLANKLGKLLSLPEADRRAMGETGRANVAKNFTVQKMCADTLAVYGELL